MRDLTETFSTSDAISRTRDRFTRELLRDLADLLENHVGLDETAHFVSIVGSRIGDRMNDEYCAAAGQKKLDREEVAQALVDLKRRIEGGFSIESIDENAIVLVNTACPFGRYVEGHPALCMMTSSVFGRIAAKNLGYAQVEIEEAIARGDPGCRVVVYFHPGDGGIEYRDDDPPELGQH